MRYATDMKDDAKKSRRALPFWVMAKPTGPRCNLDCSYCYYLDKVELYPDEGKFRMSPDILEIFIATTSPANRAPAHAKSILSGRVANRPRWGWTIFATLSHCSAGTARPAM